ncbi:MAG: lysozyme inhibitor LprI family protein [Erythrobacter sp.]|uniref:lysozyme inhibitor LprI family protein n=1 Tax=Erythrobacter sp. TaxID=1042 RepID=UPI003A861123
MIAVMSLSLLIASPPPMPPCDRDAAERGVQQEMNICAEADFRLAHSMLERQYLKTLEVMQERDTQMDRPDWDDRPGYFDTLVEAQRAWIAFRDAHCRSEGYAARGGSLEPLLLSTCKTHLTELRTAQLRELAETY